MDFKFSKGTGEQDMQETSGEKKNQSAKLILLLLLVGGFSYVYFFTGLIKPQDVPKPVEAPVAQVVKMPLPAPSSPEQKSAGTVPVPAPASATAPAPAPGAKAEPPKTEKPVQAAAVPVVKPAPPVAHKEEQKKTEAPKPADKKGLPVPTVDKNQKTVAVKPEEKKTAESKKQAATPKNEPVKPPVPTRENKDVTKTVKKDRAAAAVVAKEGKTSASGPWSVLIGQYSIEEALSADIGRVRKAGLEPVVKTGPRKKSAMNRLFLGEFSSKSEAQDVLAKLKRQTFDAFIIDSSGKYAVYAGSYMLDARAASEKERLGAAGFQVSIRHADVAIPTQSLLVGPFADKKSADAALGKLKSNGVKASIVTQ